MCRKKKYKSKLDAMLILARCNLNSKTNKRRLETRVYFCPICKCWHLTKQNNKTKRI